MSILDDILRIILRSADEIFRTGSPIAIAGFLVLAVIVILAVAYSDSSKDMPPWARKIVTFAIIGGFLYFIVGR